MFRLPGAISRKRCEIGLQSLLISNRKSYMGFRLDVCDFPLVVDQVAVQENITCYFRTEANRTRAMGVLSHLYLICPERERSDGREGGMMQCVNHYSRRWWYLHTSASNCCYGIQSAGTRRQFASLVPPQAPKTKTETWIFYTKTKTRLRLKTKTETKTHDQELVRENLLCRDTNNNTIF